MRDMNRPLLTVGLTVDDDGGAGPGRQEELPIGSFPPDLYWFRLATQAVNSSRTITSPCGFSDKMGASASQVVSFTAMRASTGAGLRDGIGLFLLSLVPFHVPFVLHQQLFGDHPQRAGRSGKERGSSSSRGGLPARRRWSGTPTTIFDPHGQGPPDRRTGHGQGCHGGIVRRTSQASRPFVDEESRSPAETPRSGMARRGTDSSRIGNSHPPPSLAVTTSFVPYPGIVEATDGPPMPLRSSVAHK